MDTVFIVLGNPPKDDGTIPYNLKTRLDLAISEYLRNQGSTLIMTGGQSHGKLIEADEMSKYCNKKGVPLNDIIQERKAKNTYDNALYTAKILQRENPKKIVIITSRFHKKRANLIFKNYFDQYSILVPKLTLKYFIRNFYIYVWEFYLTRKLIKKGDKRLSRKVEDCC